MKKSNGSAVIIIIVVILVILLISAIGIVAYQYLSTQKTNVDVNSENDQFNIETINEQNESETNNDITVEPTFNDIVGDTEEEFVNKEITSASYFYSQLDSNAKKIYSKLKKEKNNFKTGTYIFEYGTEFDSLLHEDKGQEKLKTAFQSAIDAFFYDDCSLFYVDINKINLLNESRTKDGITTYYISIGPGNNKNYLQDNFQTKEEIENAQKYIDGIINQMIDQTQKDSDELKIRKAHNWLIKVVNYEKSTNNNQYSIYGAIHDKKAVCEGYAKSFKYIMEKLNVPTILISGTGKNNEGKTESHAWNYVLIEDSWYAIDVTWDDPILTESRELSNENKYKYYLKGAEQFFKDHTESGTLSENGMTFAFPMISGSDYTV